MSPAYVILDEGHFRELVESQKEANLAHVQASLAELPIGQARVVTAEALINEHDLNAEVGASG
jgi:hypothetical protein